MVPERQIHQMKPLKRRPKKGLAAEVDGQQWRIKSQTDYAKALLLMRERVRFYKNGKLHRKDGPAIIRADGHEEWYKNGKLHRIDGPAATNVAGTQYWYQNGEYHRADGPAIVRADGSEYWYLNGKLNHAS